MLQDFIAPDLKAIGARIEALQKEMKVQLVALEREINLRFTASEQLAASRHETVLNAMFAQHASIMNSPEMEKRLARLDSERTRIEGRSQEQ